MNSSVLRRGAWAGMAGGVVMAMWSMVALAATGPGFWTPVNLIAHLVWRDAPLSGAFSLGALALGMMIHMATSMMIGVGIAIVAHRVRADAVRAAGLGMAMALGAWLANQYVIWNALDSAAADGFTPWVFALGHAMFGVVTGLLAVGAAHVSRADQRPVRPTSHTAH